MGSHGSPGTLTIIAIVRWVALTGVTVCLFACNPLSRAQQTREDPWRLYIAVLKGFEGPVHYLGSDDAFSYFRSTTFPRSYFKARTSELQLPRTFPLGAAEPYQVNVDMVE